MGKSKVEPGPTETQYSRKKGAPPTLGALVKRANVIVTGKRNQYLTDTPSGYQFLISLLGETHDLH